MANGSRPSPGPSTPSQAASCARARFCCAKARTTWWWPKRSRCETRPALPEVSFRLDQGRPTPPLPADWKTAFRGSRVEAMLQSDHVMFSPLDFPSQAGDFLDGMLREQVDRLTPWTVKEAIFGWSQPIEHGERPDRSDFRRDVETQDSAAAPVGPSAGCSVHRRIRHRFRQRRHAHQDQIVR